MSRSRSVAVDERSDEHSDNHPGYPCERLDGASTRSSDEDEEPAWLVELARNPTVVCLQLLAEMLRDDDIQDGQLIVELLLQRLLFGAV